MKIAEIFHNLAEKDADRLRELEADIRAGKRPTIHNAGWTSRGYSWSDLEELGFSEKHMEPSRSPSEMVSWWEYTGPEPVMLRTQGRDQAQVMEPGFTSDRITKDYN
jgi:hypothetical protein